MNRMLGILGVVVFLITLLIWTFYPEIPSSFFGWAALFVIGIPAYILMEWLGEVVFSSQFFKNRSSFTRILLGVPVALVLIGVAFFVISFVRQSIIVVGG
ncbi:hypothetical protein [Alishewanella sp. SMS8]|uniref:hypothetical protein n=1 Tax=Alishewanella sp. SMS8 TaxID=2994676 RepID=UPI0027418572|nr:hypothetical protein [Alishewanella sp. SMS8]MDP5460484.1 hypothetical protein [Alishewanella sp. SMS8]